MNTKDGTRPNILIIHCDQLRYDGIGCNGNEYAVTPNIDQLAQEGTVFHRHISVSPVCVPSRTSFFTGLYPHTTNVVNNGIALPRASYLENHPVNKDAKENFAISHIRTMPDWFHEHGYKTCSIGKLHLTPYNAPRSMHVEESRSIWAEGVLDDWRGPYYGFQHVEMSRGHGEGTGGHYKLWLKEHYPEVARQLETGEHKKRKNYPFSYPENELYPSVIPPEAHHSTWVGERTRSYLKNWQGSDQPFFLFAGFPDPHHPFTPPKELADRFAGLPVLETGIGPEHIEGKAEAFRNTVNTRMDNLLLASDWSDQVPQLIKQYTNAMAHLIDENVGRMIETLKEIGEYENTVIVFTSDHGDFLGDFGLFKKYQLCVEQLVHLPYVMRLPGGREKSEWPAETKCPMSNVDVFQTLSQLAGLPEPPEVQGTSVFPVLKGEQEATHPLVICARPTQQTYDPAAVRNYSIYDAQYRMTLYPDTGERELYDHDSDPYELHNLAEQPEYIAITERLHRLLLDRVVATHAPTFGRVCMN